MDLVIGVFGWMASKPISAKLEIGRFGIYGSPMSLDEQAIVHLGPCMFDFGSMWTMQAALLCFGWIHAPSAFDSLDA